MKKQTKALALHRDTLRQISAPLLPKAAAGLTLAVNSVCATCQSCHVDCSFRVTCTA